MWEIPEKRRVISKNSLNFFKMAVFGKIFIECVSKGFFAFKLSKVSDLGFCWKNRWVFWEKSLTFFQNPLFWQVYYRSRLKWCFYRRFLQNCWDWFFAKIDSFFRKSAWNFSKTKKKSDLFINCVSTCIMA